MVLIKSAMIGSPHAYQNAIFVPSSPVFDRARAAGLKVTDYQNVILVNMLGKRFYDETAKGFTANDYKSIAPYRQGSYRNVEGINNPSSPSFDSLSQSSMGSTPAPR